MMNIGIGRRERLAYPLAASAFSAGDELYPQPVEKARAKSLSAPTHP
jgi:hypothetical protein